ncbi:MAG: hypothetical protein A3E88_00875 [Legionellales bacterium RIFCSPHIGHO2_12_FULL_35_11]|nr:MAG: hypothetical protein A3E88_00875 [Legionellales bacterium RIFCSPHIGHO2_12_FULL_35_11]
MPSLIISLILLSTLGFLVLFKFNIKTEINKIIIIPSVILVVFGSYYLFGSFFELKQYRFNLAEQKRAKDILKSIKSPDELIKKLTKHLVNNPNSARGWYLLGRIYSSQNKFKKAEKAFKKAYLLEPNNDLISINYAKSLLDNGNIEGRQTLLDILEHDSKNIDVLSILAMDAYKNKQYQKSIDYWQRLLILLPENSEESIAIRKAIAKASSEKIK